MNLNNLKSLSYLFWPKYIRAKKDKVLTKAIKYHPVVELLVNSVIYDYFCLRNLLFERKSQLIALKKTKRLYFTFIYKKMLIIKKIIPRTTATIDPSTNKSFHV